MVKLEERLKKHREKTARIAVLKLEIEGLQTEINHSEGIQESDDETIEGMAFRRSLEGGGSGTVSKTESVALNYKKEQEQIKKPQTVSYLKGKIREKQVEIKRLEQETLPVEKALEGIQDREKFVVAEFFFRGSTWHTVAHRYQQTFGYIVGRKRCQQIKREAVEKMEKIMGLDKK